jgi:hypothetical protein
LVFSAIFPNITLIGQAQEQTQLITIHNYICRRYDHEVAKLEFSASFCLFALYVHGDSAITGSTTCLFSLQPCFAFMFMPFAGFTS